MERVWWVVVAAGKSKRMGPVGPKMWLSVDGRSLMERVLSAVSLTGLADGGALVVQAHDVDRSEKVVKSMFETERFVVTRGADSRAASVRRGLEALVSLGAGDRDMVLIHDGARPLVSPELSTRVVQAVSRHGAAVPLLPVVDTVKEVDVEQRRLLGTMDRGRLGLAQTPQGFRFGLIREAHEMIAPDESVTDDAEVMERLEYPVFYVAGDPVNRKITTAEDLSWLRWYLSQAAAMKGEDDENWSGI